MRGALQGGGGRFSTTQWSIVLAAGRQGSVEAQEALAELCSVYWYPVFAFVRRRGYEISEAEDLTQGFFTRLIEKGDLGDADQSRGRFRSFLRTACRNYLLNQHDRTVAIKRGGGRRMVPIDTASAESRYQRALAHEETPERVYDRQWCLTLLDRVLDTLRAEYVAGENGELFDRLRRFLTMDADAGAHSDAARELAMTPAAVKVAVHRLRRRYRDALRRHVEATVSSPAELDDEIRYLLKIVSSGM